MPRVTDHTRTEKIGGDSIFIFVVYQIVAGNRYDNIYIYIYIYTLQSSRVRNYMYDLKLVGLIK